MSTISADCPHCHKRNVSFKSKGSHCTAKDNQLYMVLFVCGNCEEGIVAQVKTAKGDPCKYTAELASQHGYGVFETYPKPKKLESPQYIPDNIKNFFMQALKNLRGENWDASGMMSRKVLDVATKKMDENLTGNLYSRIEQLESNHLITPAMKEWAHSIRLDGNEAAHDEEPMSPETAQNLLSFTEIFLMYAFTLPGMLHSRQIQKEQD